METYTSSPSSVADAPVGPEGLSAGAPAGSAGLAAALDWLGAAVANLAAVDPAQEADLPLATGVLAARRLLDQAEGAWLRLLAAADTRGAGGAEQGLFAPTAAWLRSQCLMSPALATQRVRTARALYRGPLPTVAAALAAGDVSYQHAAALADATSDLPPAKVREADPVLVDAAVRLDPPRLRRVAEHLRDVLDPDQADERGRTRLEKRGLWLSPTASGRARRPGRGPGRRAGARRRGAAAAGRAARRHQPGPGRPPAPWRVGGRWWRRPARRRAGRTHRRRRGRRRRWAGGRDTRPVRYGPAGWPGRGSSSTGSAARRRWGRTGPVRRHRRRGCRRRPAAAARRLRPGRAAGARPGPRWPA